MHWTYNSFAPDDDLQQGDILEPTDALQNIFASVHPHFLDPKYNAFLVTTQSCDLVRRKDDCATRYINLAVIRPLDDMLHDFLSHVCESVSEGVYLKEHKGEAHRLLQRIFNQNEQALGLFYLHPDLGSGIRVPSVSLLRVEVTLRVCHYKTLTESRCGRVNEEFTAKLGWLVGNLYSRVGTRDWGKEIDKLVRNTLDHADSEMAPMWVFKSWVEAARNAGANLEDIEKDRLMEFLEAYRPTPAVDEISDRTIEIVRKVLSESPGDRMPIDLLKKIANRMKNDGVIIGALKTRKK